jgi:hypothetical protein
MTMRIRWHRLGRILSGVLLVYFSIEGCSDCRDTILQRRVVKVTEIAVHHRICGSVASYSISIAPEGMSLEGRADRYEPFMMVCDCYESPAQIPVQFAIGPQNRIIVTYDRGRAWEVSKQRSSQDSFLIEYRPYGAERRPPASASRKPSMTLSETSIAYHSCPN